MLLATLSLFVLMLLASNPIIGFQDLLYLEQPEIPEPPEMAELFEEVEPTKTIEWHSWEPPSEIVEQFPHRKVPFMIMVHVYGIEGNDKVAVTSTAEGFGWGRVTRRGNGDYEVPMGPSSAESPSGVWIVNAFAEGYTVEPENYRVVLNDGKIVEPKQVLNFVFQKIS